MSSFANAESSDEHFLLPMLVDEERDLICYLGRLEGDGAAEWRFSIPNGGALKIHESVYNLMEASDRSIIALQELNSLTIQFRPENFDDQLRPGSDYENDAAGHQHFRALISALAAYDQRHQRSTDR
jgi:hypothetical protein